MQSNRHEKVCAEIERIFSGDTRFVQSIGERSDGEWQWIFQNYRATLQSAFQVRGDFSTLFSQLLNFPFSELSYGMVTLSDDEGVRHSADLGVISTGAWKDFYLLQRLIRTGSHLKEVNWRELLRVDLPAIGERGILLDSFRHSYFASLILELSSETDSTEIVEIGGGYGGLALQIGRLKLGDRKVRHLIVDLPESLLLSYWFLRMQGEKVSVVMEEKDFQVVSPIGTVLAPDYLYDSIPWKPEVLVNSRSFGEMSRETSSHYLNWADEVLAPEAILLEATGYDLFPDSTRHKERLAEDLLEDLSNYHLERSSWSPWQGGGGRYFEYVLRRNDGT